MPPICFFDAKTCDPVPQIKNGGKKKVLELNDSFQVNGQWVKVKDFFSHSYSQGMSLPLSPKQRLHHFLMAPPLKFQRTAKGEYTIHVNGKDLTVSPDLFKYVEHQDQVWAKPKMAVLKPPRPKLLPPHLGPLQRKVHVLFRVNPNFRSNLPKGPAPLNSSQLKQWIKSLQNPPSKSIDPKKYEEILKDRLKQDEVAPK